MSSPEKATLSALESRLEMLQKQINEALTVVNSARTLETELSSSVSMLSDKLNKAWDVRSIAPGLMFVQSGWIAHLQEVHSSGLAAVSLAKSETKAAEQVYRVLALEKFKYEKLCTSIRARLAALSARREQKAMDEMAMTVYLSRNSAPALA